ncbi:hypothetical protein FQN54_006188 [Arachnomyces sp. PD_36]|nr:hypothetical protein FQN54_006188 [Arachnomyces sp. PD_36]
MNRQKGKKQFFNQKNQQGQRKRSEGQSCYNCGSPEHWAQHCPEPRRPIPVGSNHNRPQKRQKTTNGPPGMLHGPPLGHHQPPGPHHGYPHPPAMHPGYPPGPHGPPTPMSAHPPHFNQWQHHAPSPYYPPPGYPPYGGHHPPTPASAYRGQFPSPASPDGMPPQHHYYPPQHPYDPHGYPRKSQDYGHRHEEYSPQESWPPRRRQSDEVPYIAPPLEPWMEELQSLDIDDSKSHGDQIVWHPPQPVARPLPSKLVANDEVVNLPPLTSLPPGMSVSKYFLNKRAEEFQSHIRDTSDWPFMMKDPVFMVISVECETIPMVELISRRNKLFEDHRVKTPTQSTRATPEVADRKEEPMDYRSPSNRSAESDYEGSRRGTRTPTPRDYRGDRDAHDEDYLEPRKGDYYDDGDNPPTDIKREYGNGVQRGGSHDSSSTAYRRSPGDNMDREPHHKHHDQGTERSQNWHKHHGPQNKKKHGGRDRDRDRDRRNGNSSNFRGQDRKTRGSRSSTGQQPSRRRSGFKHEDTGDNREFHAPENGHGGSTNGNRDQKHTNRKRGRDESPEDKGPRRQEDDVAPKNKIRRPEVAAAYSRRW